MDIVKTEKARIRGRQRNGFPPPLLVFSWLGNLRSVLVQHRDQETAKMTVGIGVNSGGLREWATRETGRRIVGLLSQGWPGQPHSWTKI